MSQYLLYSPGVRALLMWGGRQAHDTVGTIAGLAVNQPRLHETARSWHEAAGRVGSVADALGVEATRPDWDGTAADRFAGEMDRQVGRCTALARACREVGDTLASIAELMGQAHHALVAVTMAAGESLATVAPSGIAPEAGGASTAVIVDCWRSVCEQLVRYCRDLSGSAAVTLDALPADPGPT
ncbi:MAG TPA: hypothetical protein VFX70_17965 [Mycobacteriales bacterium]|nr:hypothetical protein [Mycobacteriales bacterium]